MKKYTPFICAISFLIGGAFVYFLGHLQQRKTDTKPSQVSAVDRQGSPMADRVQLTLDAGLQKIVEAELDKSFATLHPKKIIAVLADPRTGEILAMANRPAPAGASTPQLDAVSFSYEPGSTFKVLSYAGVLMNGLGDDKSQIFCENGSFPLEGKMIKDHAPLGNQTPSEILMRSSNIGAAKMALKLGATKYCELVQNFGFGHETGVGLQGESGGAIIPKEKVDDLTLARMSFGQGVSVTPLQLLMAYGAIANGGILFRPSMTLNQSGTKQSGQRIMPEGVAASLREALKLAVTDQGTRPLAQVNGLQVAGKTGTSQAVTSDGGHSETEYVTSFAGYFPADHPQVVAVVVVDGASVPADSNYGGLIAAPIFAAIAKQSASYLHLSPSVGNLSSQNDSL